MKKKCLTSLDPHLLQLLSFEGTAIINDLIPLPDIELSFSELHLTENAFMLLKTPKLRRQKRESAVL